MSNECMAKESQLALECGTIVDSHLHHRMAKNASNHKTNLIGYVRAASPTATIENQTQQLRDFCSMHGFILVKVFQDVGKSTAGLNSALSSMSDVDGLITTDIECLIQNPDDKLRDLRPLLYHFFKQTNKCFDQVNKRLIVINSGIDTGCVAGQLQAIDLFCNGK